jgi:hypothetical protein
MLRSSNHNERVWVTVNKKMQRPSSASAAISPRMSQRVESKSPALPDYVVDNAFSMLNQADQVPPAGLSQVQLVPYMQRALDLGGNDEVRRRPPEILRAMAHTYLTNPKYIRNAEYARAEHAEETARLSVVNELPDGTEEWARREIALLGGPKRPGDAAEEEDPVAQYRLIASTAEEKIPALTLAKTVNQAEPLFIDFLTKTEIFARGSSNSAVIAKRFAHLLAVLYITGRSSAPPGSDEWIAAEAASFGLTAADIDQMAVEPAAAIKESGQFGPQMSAEDVEAVFEQMRAAAGKEDTLSPRLMRLLAFAVLRKLRTSRPRSVRSLALPPPPPPPSSLRSERGPWRSSQVGSVPTQITIPSSYNVPAASPRVCARCARCTSLFPF